MTKIIKCRQCNIKVANDKCKFAIYTQIVNGKEYLFCCKKCAELYEKKRS
ncbi:MAG: transcriptional regulator [Candidatus Bathyarchaeia archaeon]